MITAGEILRAYWARMAGNDFTIAAQCLTEDVVVDWPQSNERICGLDAFARINTAYPSDTPWRFEVISLVEQGDHVVTVTDVSNGDLTARAITFSRVDLARGLIKSQVEYWPDTYPAPPWRAGQLEPIPDEAPHKMN